MTKTGRPTLSDEPTVRINAKVPQSVRDTIKQAGDGNISAGVRKLAEMAQQPHCPNPECNSTGDDLTEHEFTGKGMPPRHREMHCKSCGWEWEID